MAFGLNGLAPHNFDIEIDLRIAAEAGYDAVELQVDKLLKYINSGFNLHDLKNLLNEYAVSISSIDTLESIDTLNCLKIDKFIMQTEFLTEAAVDSISNIVRLHGSRELDDLSLKDNIKFTACNIRKLCDIGYADGLKFQYEGNAGTPIHSLEHYLMLIDEVGMDNFGVAVDFWQIWAGKGGTPDELTHFDRNSVLSVYITDGFMPVEYELIHEEDWCRRSLPGDGEVPVSEWIEAVESIGFRGIFSAVHFENECLQKELASTAAENLSRIKMYF